MLSSRRAASAAPGSCGTAGSTSSRLGTYEVFRWRMSPWSAPSGATRARARSSTGCPAAPMSSCASRAATMPATRWSSATRSYKLSLLPSGIVRPASSASSATAWWSTPGRCWPRSSAMRAQGVEVAPENLLLAENAALILPLHGALDRAREAARGESKIGTTGRGIGPAYEDKVGRRAIRVCDLADAGGAAGQDREPAAASQRAAARPGRRRGRPGRAAGPAARGRAEDPALSSARCGSGWTR